MSNELVLIVDDDASVRRSLQRLLSSHGYAVATFASAEELLASALPAVPACLVLDVRLPGRDGLELQQALADRADTLPIVFISGHGDIPTSVRAVKAGAEDFLAKPVGERVLIPAVAQALRRSARALQAQATREEQQRRLDTLSPREREVLRLVVAGLLNKQIAERLGIAEGTVKIHRGHITTKLGVRSVADLVRVAQATGLAR